MKLWFALLASAAILLPQLNFFSFGIHPFDVKRVGQLVIVIAALVVLSTQPQPKPKHSTLTICALFLLLAVFSVINATYPAAALLDLSNSLAILAAAYLFSLLPRAPEYALFVAVAASSLYLLSAIAHLGNSMLLGIDQQVVARLPGFSNIRAFSHWQTWTLPLIGALPFFKRHLTKIPGYWLWALAIGWWFLFYIAAGRGTALGTLVGIAAVLVIYRHAALPWLRVLIIAAIAGNLLGWLWITAEEAYAVSRLHTDGGLLNTHSSGRWGLWTETWQIFLSNPWFGVGPMHYANATESPFGSPHNFALLTLAEYGLFAGLLAFAFLGKGLWALVKGPADKQNINIAIWLTAACFAASAHSLFSGVQLAPYSQLWLIIVVGATLNMMRTPISNVKSQSKLMPVAAVMLGCVLIASLAYTIMNPDFPNPWADIVGKHFPRFWSHGQF